MGYPMTQQSFRIPLADNSFAYDHIYNPDETAVKFYTQLAARNSQSVLDLGCGSGYLTLPLAKQGLKVTGLDISPSMLDIATAKSETAGLKINWIEANFIDFNLKQQFDMIVMSGCTLQYIENIHQVEQCLEQIKKHLKPKGLFVFDIYNPSLPLLCRDPDERYFVASYADSQNRAVTVRENNLYDTATQINHITWYYSREDAPDYKVDILKMRQFFPQEIRYILEKNGLAIENCFGDFSGNKFTPTSPRQIFLAKPEKTARWLRV